MTTVGSDWIPLLFGPRVTATQEVALRDSAERQLGNLSRIRTEYCELGRQADRLSTLTRLAGQLG